MRFTLIPLMMSVGIAIAASEEPAKTDADKVKGAWKVTVWEHDGLKAVAQELAEFNVDIVEGKIVIQQKLATFEAKFKIDAKEKTFLMVPTKGNFEGQDLPGIYKFDGEKLWLCWSEKGKKPAEFTGKKDSGQVLMVLERKQ